jgi:energy-coupling factor transporter transmembrane protein EcfT
MEPLAAALALLITQAVHGPLRLGASLAGCALAMAVLRARFAPLLARLVAVWLGFYALVGVARWWGGAPVPLLLQQGAANLGLALGVSCALLLVLTARPAEVLAGLDRLRVPRDASYVALSVVRLLPQVAAVGARQMALLELKGIGRRTLAQRLSAYRRIAGPLFAILSAQQLAHTRGLAARGFFGPPPVVAQAASLLGARGRVLVALLLLNAVLWFAAAWQFPSW